MAEPKKKTSKSRRGMRRSHDGIKARGVSTCSKCHEIKLPHNVCFHCGYYKGVEVLKIEEV
ncbi:MAG: 50S ribosomal protein L32 [Nitrospinota bacterium]